jgi:hypothetical protein
LSCSTQAPGWAWHPRSDRSVAIFHASRTPRWNVGLVIVLAAAILFLLVLIFRLYIRRNPPRPFRRSSSGNFRRTHRAVGPLVEFEGGEGCRGGSTGCGCAIRFARHAPREYFNEIIGGTKNGHLYFSDEGVDIWQRGKEIAEYYHHVLEPSGEVPIVSYEPIGEPEKKALGLDWLGRDPKRDETRLSSPIFSGTVLINARFLGTWPFWDSSSLRDTAPSARFGNLLVFRGTCACGAILAPAS